MVSIVIIAAIIISAVYIIFNYKKMKINRYTWQKIALALSIIIVLNLFFNYGVYTFYPTPKYEEFCTEKTQEYYGTKDECESVGGKWINGRAYPGYEYERPVPISPEAYEPKDYCDGQYSCRKDYDEARNLYNRNVFIVLIILGAASIIMGFVTTAVSAVSSGFMFGGLISLFIGTVRYWSGMNDYLRLIVLGIVLAGLIWMGYKKLKDKEEEKAQKKKK